MKKNYLVFIALIFSNLLYAQDCIDDTEPPALICPENIVVEKDTGVNGAALEISGITSKIDVLLLHADYDEHGQNVQKLLMATGNFSSVLTFNISSRVPELSGLLNYDAILLWRANDYPNPEALGDVLAAYVDAGGALVLAAMTLGNSVASYPTGAFDVNEYGVISPLDIRYGPQAFLGEVLQPGHPLMEGVSSFDGGSVSYRSWSQTLTPGSYRIANWTDADSLEIPLIAAKENVGPANARRVDLNFYPPSQTIDEKIPWDENTDGARIMANALSWAAGVSLAYDNCGPVAITNDFNNTSSLSDFYPVGTTPVTITATDGAGNSSTCSFTVTVTSMNAPPTIDTVANVTVSENDSTVIISLTGISDGDESVEQDVSVTAVSNNPELVDSVVVDYAGGETDSLEIHLAADMNGIAEITITVEDSEGASVTETFTLTVTPVNHPPFVVNPIADQVVNASYVLKVPVSPVLGELFDDPESDDLTISAMLEGGNPLPDWAVMVNDSLVFSPMIADTGCVKIIVMATDPAGAAAMDTFQLCVEGNLVSAPTLDAPLLEVNMYPNPAKDWVNLKVKNAGLGTAEVIVYTITGKQIIRKNFNDSQNISFNMEKQVSGMYFVKLNLAGKEIVKKLVLDRK